MNLIRTLGRLGLRWPGGAAPARPQPVPSGPQSDIDGSLRGTLDEALDEALVVDPAHVRRMLWSLDGRRRLLSLRGPLDARDAHALLTLDGIDAERLTLKLEPLSQPPQGSVNVTAAGERGLLLFTLDHPLVLPCGRILADWPHQLLQMQSRRHYRVCGLCGSGRRAELAWVGAPEGASPVFRLRDLSEEGACLEIDRGQVLPDAPRLHGACLHLDGRSLLVPWLEIVHRRCGASGAVTVGARLLGMGAQDLRCLRRWITQCQAQALVH